MRTLCCIGLNLLLAGSAVSLSNPTEEEVIKPFSDEYFASLKKDLKNPEKLKRFLLDRFEADWYAGPVEFRIILAIKTGNDMQDEIVRPVLLEIYREAAQKTGWKSMTDDGQAEKRLFSSIFWMGAFVDEPTKKLLLDIAKDHAKDVFYRYPAILGYIHCADAQEVRDLFIWLLSDGKRFPTNLRATLMEHIRRLWEDIETDQQKREAIIASLCVVVAQEKDAWTFGSLDNFLSEANKEYATSRQRVELLKKNGKKSLADSISKSQQNAGKPLTNISTSLKELKARDFSKPPENKP